MISSLPVSALVLLRSLYTNTCIRAINSHVENIEYLVKQNVFIYLKLESTSRYKIINNINLSFSIFCRYYSVSAEAKFSYENDRENTT